MARLSTEQSEALRGKWFVAYVKNGCEFKASNTLYCDSVVPVTQKIVKSKSKNCLKSKIIPKFKNYVYVCHDGTPDFFDVISSNEYVQYFPGMTRSSLPPAVSLPEIQHFIEHECSDTLLKKGDVVKVVDGYLKGMNGVVMDTSLLPEIIVEIKILDKIVRENILREYLIKIEE